MNSKFDPKSYWETRLTDNYNLRGVGDIGLSESYNNCLYCVRSNAFKYLVKRFGLNDVQNHVLDIGSGTGFYVNQWLDVGVRHLTGSDLTDTAVSNLQAKYPNQKFLQLDIGSVLPEQLSVRRFDVVTAYDMLFHVVDDRHYVRAIKNFSNLVRPGGFLIFSDNLSPSKEIRIEHQVSRSESEVFALMKENGFILKKIMPMFVFMNDPVRSSSRIMRKLFSLTYRFASKGDVYGRVVGGFLYPLETLLIRLLKRGPSTEIFVWERTADSEFKKATN